MTTKAEFIISRTFDAPRKVVWKAWTDPEEMKKWWGPKGATVTAAKMDFRLGGTYHYGMKYSGQEMWGKFIYREIVPPERIVWVNCFSDEKGGVTRHPMNPDWPRELLTVFTLSEQNGKSTVTITWSPISPTEAEQKTFDEGHKSMQMGWTGTFEQFEEYLKKT